MISSFLLTLSPYPYHLPPHAQASRGCWSASAQRWRRCRRSCGRGSTPPSGRAHSWSALASPPEPPDPGVQPVGMISPPPCSRLDFIMLHSYVWLISFISLAVFTCYPSPTLTTPGSLVLPPPAGAVSSASRGGIGGRRAGVGRVLVGARARLCARHIRTQTLPARQTSMVADIFSPMPFGYNFLALSFI